jgi:putative ABC transport system permease protein
MNLRQDIRYGARMLRKSPGFTVTVLLTLGVAVGLTSAVYSVCDAMLWKPVALPRLETLVMVLQREPGGGADNWEAVTPADLEDISRNDTAIENIASWRGGVANIVGASGQPEGVLQALVSANFFTTIGVQPALGRSFQSGEDEPGQDREVILSNRLWKNRFGAERTIIGNTVRLDARNFVVIGIMPDSFDFPLATDVWIPNALTAAERTSRRSNTLLSLARLKQGHSAKQASAQIDSIGTRLEKLYPDTNKSRRFEVIPAHRFLVNYQRQQYLITLLASGVLVLLIGCINVANLQFARATGRVREVAVRTALGASRAQVIAQLLTESILLSIAGAALGLALGKWGMSLIKAGMPIEIQKYALGWKDIQLDGRVLVFTLIAAGLSGILSGLAPAWQSSRPDLTMVLNEGGRSGATGTRQRRLGSILVAVEVAFAVVLLVGAALMVRGFRAQIDTSAKIDPATLLTFRLAIADNKYHEPHQEVDFYREVLTRISRLPGVRSAAAVTALPYSNHSTSGVFTIEGRAVESDDIPRGMFQIASSSYFETLHIPLQSGRFLSESDGPNAPKVALISARMAARWWTSGSPIGQHIRVGGVDSNNSWLTIVGVVGDVIQSPYDREPRRIFYLPYQQAPALWMDIVVRTSGDPLEAAPGVTQAVRSVDSEQSVLGLRTMENSIRNSAIGLTYMATLMGIFGMIALGLSSIGVYAVMAHLVSSQTREIGVRLALGAQRQSVLAMIFRHGMTRIAFGLAAGLPLAWSFSHLLASVIYGVSATDVITFVGVPLALIVVASLAVYIPARRAMKIDPMVALHYE